MYVILIGSGAPRTNCRQFRVMISSRVNLVRFGYSTISHAVEILPLDFSNDHP